jgi:hypothetical protein
MLCHISNGSADFNKVHSYNNFLINKYNSLDLMMEHHRSRDCSTWGPHMHTRRLYHRFRPPQSTSTISFGHRTPEHHSPHACTASPITIAAAA